MRGRYLALTLLAFAVGAGGGIAAERFFLGPPQEAGPGGPEILYWVAPMDPNFRRDNPGKSPMGMDLVPVYAGAAPAADPAEVELSGSEINAIGVRTATSRLEPLSAQIETVGFVGFDEHKTSHVHMRVEGWIEDLAVRALGDQVRAGDLLFTIYAPEITVASAELQRAVRRGETVEAHNARRKLRNFGASASQIERIARAAEPAQYLRVYAPQDGIVTNMAAADGMYLTPDVRAMSLSDLSTVWLLVDVFEQDIARLTAEMRATARFEHLPGQIFEGAIDYIYPDLDPTTRTLPVRLRFDNREGLLKPNMFGRVTLVSPEERLAITVPSEAVIRTGRAERVILETGAGRFKPRLVTTGLADGFGPEGRTEVVQGLAAGEVVVASAQFLLDSESALNAGLLRMAPTQAEPARGKGFLVDSDPATRTLSILHEAIPALDWPALETRFPMRAGLELDPALLGQEVRFTLARGADGQLSLIDIGRDDGVAASGTGIIHAVTADGKLTLSHDPIPDLGWPAMRMDLAVKGLDPGAVPLETPVTFDLAEDADGLYSVVAVRAETRDGSEPQEPEAASQQAQPQMTMVVDGRVNSVDRAAGRANVTHGPIDEIGMPGMTMSFPLGPGLGDADLDSGPATLTLARNETGGLVLVAVTPKPPAMRVSGTINSVSPDGRSANVTHGPLQEIGMPGMTMSFPLAADLEASGLPVGQEVMLLIRRGDGHALTLVGVEGE
ncbi:MAG: efflux RND transporter periplasmic adaptor subunit [Pseudomonadota bacterium]